MHPELLNNSLFLRYYAQWQKDPTSIVFAPIAEYLLHYDMPTEAIKICREGIRVHPKLISGHLVMAKIHMKQENWDRARDSIRAVFSIVPENRVALELNDKIESLSGREESSETIDISREISTETENQQRTPSWETVTMANIYSAQGHYDRARKIYQSILNRDPDNGAARKGLETLPQAEI